MSSPIENSYILPLPDNELVRCQRPNDSVGSNFTSFAHDGQSNPKPSSRENNLPYRPEPISSMSSLAGHPTSASASPYFEQSQLYTEQFPGISTRLGNHFSSTKDKPDQTATSQQLEPVVGLSTTRNLGCADRGFTTEQDVSAARSGSLDRSFERPTVLESNPAGSIHGADDGTNGVIEPNESIISPAHYHPPDTMEMPALPTQRWMCCFVSMAPLRQAVVSSWVRLYSSLDIRATVRFIVAIFSYLMGIATTFSVSIAPERPDDALPSLTSDSYPTMVAQVVASLLSPLLFSLVSIRDHSTPIRQKLFSFYYFLLVVGVAMSLASLLLYSLWPTGYRATNVTTIWSLVFTVLGGWQFLEKSWEKAAEEQPANEDIELGSRQV
ncbi:hypothetical protein M434DRAFT_392067 [Hypoxylon sp. CO27-5]|nr:hypothetical protein M434DRAFT_392067 [Hypoxylon sp. CO27-5]